MTVLEEMCDIVVDQAGERLRFFAAGDPDGPDVEVLHLREDLAWTEHRRNLADAEMQELVAKEAYEVTMDATNVNQIVKVADDKILFTGFVDDSVAIAAFDRGILPALPGIVGEFREHMREEDVDFIALDM